MAVTPLGLRAPFSNDNGYMKTHQTENKISELTEAHTICLLNALAQEFQLSRKIECCIPILIPENQEKRKSYAYETRNVTATKQTKGKGKLGFTHRFFMQKPIVLFRLVLIYLVTMESRL